MPKHKQSSSPVKKGNYNHYLTTHRAYSNKVRNLEKQIKLHTKLTPSNVPSFGSMICSDSCAVEALKRLKAAGTWDKSNRHIKR